MVFHAPGLRLPRKARAMSELPERKVGIVACSGEELAEGTVARLAALRVLNELRPGRTVTICLPLFLAGGAEDRAFARVHPTITVDGCDLRCAARGTEKYSSKPVASLVVSELVARHGLPKPEGCRRLNAAARETVELVAQELTALVDQTVGFTSPGAGQNQSERRPSEATCSCGAGIPVRRVAIGDQTVEFVALEPILQKFRAAGRGPDETTLNEVLELVKVYNDVPAAAEADYRHAIRREFSAYCQAEGNS
jgi:uncharacterized metal-binding protein